MGRFDAVRTWLKTTVLSVSERASLRRRNEVWRVVAEKHGLTVGLDGISGKINGIEVGLRERETRDDRGAITVWWANLAHHMTLPTDLQITTEGFINKARKLTGLADIQLDLPEIDRKLLVQGADADEVRDWAHRPGVADALAQLAKNRWNTWHLNDFEIEVTNFGQRIVDADQLEQGLHDIANIARGLLSLTK